MPRNETRRTDCTENIQEHIAKMSENGGGGIICTWCNNIFIYTKPQGAKIVTENLMETKADIVQSEGEKKGYILQKHAVRICFMSMHLFMDVHYLRNI